MNDMRKLMETIEQLSESPDVSGYASAITALIDRMADVIVEDYYNSDNSDLDTIIKNIMHDATVTIKLRLPDRIKHYNKYAQNYKDTYGIKESEQLNEVSDYDGPELDALIAQFEETCKAFRIGSYPVKKKDLMNVVLARAEDTQDMSGLGHENVLGNDHEANFGGWPDKQR